MHTRRDEKQETGLYPDAPNADFVTAGSEMWNEGRIQDPRFQSWQAVLDFVAESSVSVADVAACVLQADPSAGEDAVAAFIWGAAQALKARTRDPASCVAWIARGLQGSSRPGSWSDRHKLAEAQGKLAVLLLRRWSRVVAIAGNDIGIEEVGNLLSLARISGELRGQTWDAVLVTRESGEIVTPPGCVTADAEFSSELGLCRVRRSSAAGRRAGSPPVVYAVSSVAEGIAVLDFEMANLCVALSGPEAVVFAHPVIGGYAKKARTGIRLVRAVAAEPHCDQTEAGGLMSDISTYMVDMYADLRIYGLGLSGGETERLGGVRITGAGALEALMRLAVLAASAAPKGLA